MDKTAAKHGENTGNGGTPAPGAPHRWKKGQSGNPGGRPKSRPITEAMRKALEAGDLASMADLAKTGIEKAMAGDHRFWHDVMDRLDGPVRQEIQADVTMRTADELIEDMDAVEEGGDADAGA